MGRLVRQSAFGARALTAPFRPLPDFLLIGAERCGTTSLYDALVQHPEIRAAWRKEVNYFSVHHGRGSWWYRAHFPAHLTGPIGVSRRWQTGEASPGYLFHPRAGERAAAFVPDIKLLVLVRDPVDRAYSAYFHYRLSGRESGSFADAIEREWGRTRAELTRMARDPAYRCWEHGFYGYLARGLYSSQVERWLEHFPRERVLIESTESLGADGQAVFDRVCRFLGLSEWTLPEVPRRHRRRYPEPMPAPLRERLREFFAPHNEALYELLGRDLGWSRP